MASCENKVLQIKTQKVEDKTMSKPLCSIFDGAIFDARRIEDRDKFCNCIRSIEKKPKIKLTVIDL